MRDKRLYEKYTDWALIILTILVNLFLLGGRYDYYYDLNDDVMMKDVMSGVYSGVPDGHNMQTLYALGALISLCYKICPSVPWYGLFLCVCGAGCLVLTGKRLLGLLKSMAAKISCMAVFTLFIWGVWLSHIVALQYTLICAMLASAAVFLFMTTKDGLSVKRFIVSNIPSVLLVILAYQLRSEMLLLLFPFICLAGVFRWARERKIFCPENFIKYGVVIGCILAGMLISALTDSAAYGSGQWKAAVEFFDARTRVYDFHYDVLTSGEHSDGLALLGLSGAQQELLANYNFGLDEDIDEVVMGQIADYAEENDITPFNERLDAGIRQYVYRVFHLEDAPYNLLIIAGYLCVFVSGLYGALKNRGNKKSFAFIWELVLLALVRSALWLYIIINGRTPERITHSLYLAEGMVLAGMFMARNFIFPCNEDAEAWKDIGNWKDTGKGKYIAAASLALVGAIALISLPESIRSVDADMERREEANKGAQMIAAYCKARPENFYFEDVYSTVGFSQKIFKNVDNSPTNYDIMGGWMCKTPLYKEKLARFGLENTQDGLLGGGAYFIVDEEESGTDWLVEYYYDKGYDVALKHIDIINGRYAVYQVVEE